MKKAILLIILALLATSFVACKKNTQEDDIITDAGKSIKFDEKETNKAIDTVKNEFDFERCTLKKVWYEQEKSDYETSGYLEYGRGSINGVKPEM